MADRRSTEIERQEKDQNNIEINTSEDIDDLREALLSQTGSRIAKLWIIQLSSLAKDGLKFRAIPTTGIAKDGDDPNTL